MMNIFPKTLVRIGGSSFDDLEALRLDSTFAKEFHQLMEKKKSIQQEILDKLYGQIGNLNDTDHQNLLLNLKRDVFNERLDSKDKISDLWPMLSKSIQRLISDYLSAKLEVKEKESAFESEYVDKTEKIREHFKTLVRDPSLQKGLLLSSKSLFRRIDAYLKKPPDQFSRNDVKAELGLLKYLTRMKAKTSPFSTFTNLAIASHTSNGEEIFSFEESDSSVESHIRLNNAMFVYLQSLLFHHPDVYPWFLVALNPTIRLEKNTFLFLINHRNIESFQRIIFNPLLGLVREMLESPENKHLKFQELVDVLIEHVDASQEEISGYVKQLIDFGFLEFDLGVSGLDPDWDLKLGKVMLPLEEKEVPFIAELRQVLNTVREKAVQVESSGLSKREHLINEAFDTFKAFCMKLHKAAGLPEEERLNEKELRKKNQNKVNEKNSDQEQNGDEKNEEPFRRRSSTWFRFKPETIFYEDTSLKIPMSVDASATKAIVQSIDGLLQTLRQFDGVRQGHQKRVDYFISQYGKGKSVPLFTFYESYYRDVKKPETKKKQQIKKNRKKHLERREKIRSQEAPKPPIRIMSRITSIQSLQKKRWSSNAGKPVLTHF